MTGGKIYRRKLVIHAELLPQWRWARGGREELRWDWNSVATFLRRRYCKCCWPLVVCRKESDGRPLLLIRRHFGRTAVCSAAASWQGQAPLSLSLLFSDWFQQRFICVLSNGFVLEALFFRWHFANELARPAARVDDNWLRFFLAPSRLLLVPIRSWFSFSSFFRIVYRSKFLSCMKWLCAVLKNGRASRQGRQNLRRRVHLFQTWFEVISWQQRVGFIFHTSFIRKCLSKFPQCLFDGVVRRKLSAS